MSAQMDGPERLPHHAPEQDGRCRVSVVVTCVNAFSDFHTCATAILAQSGPRIHIIAVERLGPAFATQVGEAFPQTQVISVAPDTTIPEMRTIGFRASETDIVGSIEDHVILPPDWSSRMAQEIDAGSDVVAGPLDNMATEKLVDWAAFLCEYSAILPPLNDGPSDWLPGNNTAYKRETLQRYDALLDDGKWENHLHGKMKADGATLTLRNDIVSGHKMHYTFWLYFSQRYLYSRSFAGDRVKDAPAHRKALMGVMALALPAVVLVRVTTNVLRKGQYKWHLLRSMPMILPFALSWGIGEVVGYWFGPGRALTKVR